MNNSSKKRIVIALGGNALGLTPSEQLENVKKTAQRIIPLVKDGNEIVITHGNGPQVGLINFAFESGNKYNSNVKLMPFPECGAMSQGYIGFHLQNSLMNELLKNGLRKSVTSVITQVVVSENDPAFNNPTKPIGSFYSLEEIKKTNYPYVEDAKRGYRRVIASPLPVDIIEKDAILGLIKDENIVIAVGGGGIPVVKKDDEYVGVDAVIDKDYASSLLADLLDADIFLIVTAVSKVSLNYGKENQIDLDSVNLEEAKKYINDKHFYEGSMLPKVKAAMSFVAKNKKRISIITSIDDVNDAIYGKSGTKIIN